MTEAGNRRPKRVIMVDAENPLEEIQGEFFWREDHEALLTAARDQAYRAGHDAGYSSGYRAGWSDATRQGAPHTVVVRRRRSFLGWVRLSIVLLLVATLVPIIVGTVIEQLLSRS